MSPSWVHYGAKNTDKVLQRRSHITQHQLHSPTAGIKALPTRRKREPKVASPFVIMNSENRAVVSVEDEEDSSSSSSQSLEMEVPREQAPSDLVSQELDRSRVLKSYHQAMDDADPDLDRLARLAARILGAENAAISLVDISEAMFLTHTALSERLPPFPSKGTMCTHTIQSDDGFVVHDASKHEITRTSPYVMGPPYVRFYCGAPLVVPEGYRVSSR